jgi:glycosyltransferase involved in cell wall biosynthesis
MDFRVTMAARVTVVSPLYNGARYVPVLIDCMRAQTLTDWRYVIVDNHSADGTGDLAQRLAAGDPRISVVRNPETWGVIRNHNEAFRQVTPESGWFRFLQADDVLLPDNLARCVSLGESNARIGIVGSWLQWGDELTSNQFPLGVNVFSGREVSRRTLKGEVYPFLTPSALLWRMEAVRNREPFFDERFLYADVMACYETLRTWDFGVVDAVLTEVGRDEESVTNRVTKSFNKLLGSNLHLFTLHGREFLDATEYQTRLEEHVANYYAFLGRSRFERREPGFWTFHHEMFKTCGLTLEASRLRSATWAALRESPRWMLRNLVRSYFPERR